MSPRTRKRPSLTPEPVKNSNVTKKPRKSKEHSDVRNSEDDSGFPSSSSSINDSKNETPTKKKKIASNDETPKSRSRKGKSLKSKENQDVNQLDIAQLLALGEGTSSRQDEETIDDPGGMSDSDVSDMEEVEEEKMEVQEPVIPKEGVNITLEVPDIHAHRRKKQGLDVEAHIRRQVNRVKKEMQLLMHKVHLLCWIAHLRYVNQVLNSQELMGISLSLVKSQNLYPPKYADISYLERIVKWFNKTFELKENVKDPECTGGLSGELFYQFGKQVAYTKRYLILMFVIMMRVLGLKTRVVMSFQVVRVKPTLYELDYIKPKPEKPLKAKKEAKEKESLKPSKAEEKTTPVNEESSYFSKGSKKPEKDSSSNTKKSKSKAKELDNESKSESNSTAKENEKSKRTRKLVKNNSVEIKNLINRTPVNKAKSSVQNKTDSDSDDELLSKHFKPSSIKKSLLKVKKENDSSQYFSKKKAETSKGESSSKRSKARTKNPKQSIKNEDTKLQTPENVKPVKNKIIEIDSSDTDSDFTPQSLKKSVTKKEIDRRVLSSEEEETPKKKQGIDVWPEVFLESEEKWICVDVPRQKVHCVNDLYTRATAPVTYIIACNNDSTLKDVTKRYVPNWHSDTRRKRVDEEWWNETMEPYLPPKTAQDREEDEDINRQLHDKPLPTVISEYKDHPLYALKRHLLKFEGIYPPDAPTLGFVRGEPVYARECVVTLRSREIWFKEARVVRLKEEPYKIVKSRPKYDKMTGEFKKDLPLELFGFWQTEEYIPPIAVDGKVPRNEYGNVDLFKPCMLPRGTVHLQIPALNRIAKKLGIDCAPAIVGFDFHSGGSHPVHDGFVVCEEFKEVLLDAWNKEVDESAKRNEEKREKRIYGNWKRLIRGLLIREKLKIKYSFGDNSDDEHPQKSSTATPSTSKKQKRSQK